MLIDGSSQLMVMLLLMPMVLARSTGMVQSMYSLTTNYFCQYASTIIKSDIEVVVHDYSSAAILLVIHQGKAQESCTQDHNSVPAHGIADLYTS